MRAYMTYDNQHEWTCNPGIRRLIMTTTHITLHGRIDYNERRPPCGARPGYVARITGTINSPVKYDREFLGREEVTLELGDPSTPGLYERQRGDRGGGYTRWYHVVLTHPEYGLILSVDCEEQLPKIARLLDQGISIQDAVEIRNLRPSSKVAGRMVFDALPRTLAEVVRV
jgi:hypothetical protein